MTIFRDITVFQEGSENQYVTDNSRWYNWDVTDGHLFIYYLNNQGQKRVERVYAPGSWIEVEIEYPNEC